MLGVWKLASVSEKRTLTSSLMSSRRCSSASARRGIRNWSLESREPPEMSRMAMRKPSVATRRGPASVEVMSTAVKRCFCGSFAAASTTCPSACLNTDDSIVIGSPVGGVMRGNSIAFSVGIVNSERPALTLATSPAASTTI